MKTSLRLVLCFYGCSLISVCSALAQNPDDLRGRVVKILSAEFHIGDPSFSTRIDAMTARFGVETNLVEEVLIALVTDSVANTDETSSVSVVGVRAASILASMRSKDAVPSLKQLIHSESYTMRDAAIRAVVQIEGAASLQFADEIVKESASLTSADRRSLYEALIELRKSNSQLNSVQEWLTSAAQKDDSLDNIVILDAELAQSGDTYKNSAARDAIQKRIKSLGDNPR